MVKPWKNSDMLKTLADNNIFVFPSPEGYTHHVLYAPLADSAFLASDEDIKQLANALKRTPGTIDEYLDVIQSLTDVTTPDKRPGYIRRSSDFINLSILPNNICNFSCRYCYSANGRSKAHMTCQMAQTMIKYFIDTRAEQNPKLLTFSIFGGGEPLLSWGDVVRPNILYIYAEMHKREQKHVITLITNGSLLPDDFIDLCKHVNIDLVVSFDVLKDVQNAQRRHYELVSSNLHRLIDGGIVPAINSVVTSINVERLAEMVEQLHVQYPEIKHVAFEPVIGEVDDLDTFYALFIRNFIDARRKADIVGIKLTCTALRNVDVTVDRYCPGEMALCADGSITCCPCVSSPQEPNYDRYVYGKVNTDGVSIDELRLSQILSVNVHSQPDCRYCWAKWNCGGGCTNTNVINGGKPHTAYCNMVRTLTRYIITHRLEQSYREEGQTITMEIGNYEQIIR